MNVTAALEGAVNSVDNHRRLLGHRARPTRVAAAAPGNDLQPINVKCWVSQLIVLLNYFRDPSPGRIPNAPIECAPRPQAIRRQSSTTEEILIARGFRRQSTTEEMIRCRNFRRQSSQSDDTCQRFVFVFASKTLLIGSHISIFFAFADTGADEVSADSTARSPPDAKPQSQAFLDCIFDSSSVDSCAQIIDGTIGTMTGRDYELVHSIKLKRNYF